MTYPTSSNLKTLTEYLAAYVMEEIGRTPIAKPLFEEIQVRMIGVLRNGIEAFCSGASPAGLRYAVNINEDHAELNDPCQQESSDRLSADCIQITWYLEDVQMRRPDLTKEQCREVLSKLERGHDAEIGINWDVIDAVADGSFPEPDNLDELREQDNQQEE